MDPKAAQQRKVFNLLLSWCYRTVNVACTVKTVILESLTPIKHLCD